MWTTTVPVVQYSKFGKLMYVTRALATCTPDLNSETAGYDRSYSESNGPEGRGTVLVYARLLPVNLAGLTIRRRCAHCAQCLRPPHVARQSSSPPMITPSLPVDLLWPLSLARAT